MLIPFAVAFQLAAAAGPVYNGRDGHIVAHAIASSDSITIDGSLDEPIWRAPPG